MKKYECSAEIDKYEKVFVRERGLVLVGKAREVIRAALADALFAGYRNGQLHPEGVYAAYLRGWEDAKKALDRAVFGTELQQLADGLEVETMAAAGAANAGIVQPE